MRAFGAREVIAGLYLLNAPAHATGVWNRVAGDTTDLVTLGAAAAATPRNRKVWASLAFVVGATILDVIAARGLDRTTGTAAARTNDDQRGRLDRQRSSARS